MNRANRTWLVVLGLCGVATALRLGAWLPNVSAVGALALYSGSRLRWWAWLPPLAVMAATDALLWKWFGYPPFSRPVYAAFLIEALLGMALVQRPTWRRVGLAGFLGALQFYLITNFFVWLKAAEMAHPTYTHDLAGLLNCYIMALPFFGYTLFGNLLFAFAAFGADALLGDVNVASAGSRQAQPSALGCARPRSAPPRG